MENARTHPYFHYTPRTTSKSQHTPETTAPYTMILTSWSHVLTALFHCSLPPYVLPDCMKWLLRENKQNHGFSLAQKPLLAHAAHAIATDQTITSNLSHDHPQSDRTQSSRLLTPHFCHNASKHIYLTLSTRPADQTSRPDQHQTTRPADREQLSPPKPFHSNESHDSRRHRRQHNPLRKHPHTWPRVPMYPRW